MSCVNVSNCRIKINLSHMGHDLSLNNATMVLNDFHIELRDKLSTRKVLSCQYKSDLV